MIFKGLFLCPKISKKHPTDTPCRVGKKVGGVIVGIDKNTHSNHLEILFVVPEEHTKGLGYAAWKAIEKLYPETEVWETCTPYFEKRNIHFYVNKCGFKIVDFLTHFTLTQTNRKRLTTVLTKCSVLKRL